jgi:hypothetical protein
LKNKLQKIRKEEEEENKNIEIMLRTESLARIELSSYLFIKGLAEAIVQCFEQINKHT